MQPALRGVDDFLFDPMSREGLTQYIYMAAPCLQVKLYTGLQTLLLDVGIDICQAHGKVKGKIK